MILCASCVADVMNDPYAWSLRGDESLPPSVERLAEVIELYAAENPQRPAIIIVGGGQRSRPVTLRAVSTVDGVPLCAWCLAARPWMKGPRR